jgi:hypothetical protein
MAIIQYLTPFSFMLPHDYKRVAPFRDLARPELPALARIALGGE